MSKPTIDDMYESEHDKFVRELFAQRPHLVEQQKEARAIWWDKKVNQEELKRFNEAKVPQGSYVYFDWLNK